jgi:hypothetical protein
MKGPVFLCNIVQDVLLSYLNLPRNCVLVLARHCPIVTLASALLLNLRRVGDWRSRRYDTWNGY